VRPRRLGTLALVSSGLAHAAAYWMIARAPCGASDHRAVTTASFAILPTPPRAPENAPPAAEPEPPKPPVENRARPRVRQPPADPPAPPPPETNTDPEPALAATDLTGITLTNALGTGWFSATGDGSSRTGPLRNVQAAPERDPSGARASSKPARADRPRSSAPALVAPEDLSLPPRAPDLNGALEANYPPEARAAGLSGMAVIRALISPTGEARVLGILSESAPGFGTACLKTLTGSRWSAPVDRTGRTVATEIRYRCTFRVAR
jgi:hypothetical protein